MPNDSAEVNSVSNFFKDKSRDPIGGRNEQSHQGYVPWKHFIPGLARDPHKIKHQMQLDPQHSPRDTMDRRADHLRTARQVATCVGPGVLSNRAQCLSFLALFS